jgi:hypothetical protein
LGQGSWILAEYDLFFILTSVLFRYFSMCGSTNYTADAPIKMLTHKMKLLFLFRAGLVARLLDVYVSQGFEYTQYNRKWDNGMKD